MGSSLCWKFNCASVDEAADLSKWRFLVYYLLGDYWTSVDVAADFSKYMGPLRFFLGSLGAYSILLLISLDIRIEI